MTGKTTVITKEILENFDFKNYKSPSDFIEKSWNYYKDSFDSNNSINGTIFENLVAYVLAYEGIDNIYEQAEVAYDLLGNTVCVPVIRAISKRLMLAWLQI